MCVVLEKLGRASLRVRGSGVCISMKAMEGRRRTMWLEGYLRSSSRSRYLLFVSLLLFRIYSFLLIVGWGAGSYSSQNAMVCKERAVSFGRQRGRGENVHYQ
jgi:hypothetical protein